MNNKCFYLVEGACERQLINALKTEPARLIPGSIIVHNVVQKTIPKAYVASFGRNSFVTLVFDTDIPQNGISKGKHFFAEETLRRSALDISCSGTEL